MAVGQHRVRHQASLLLAEPACITGDPEQALVRADEIDSTAPWTRIHASLLKGSAGEQAGLRLEARAALADGVAALSDLHQGLDAPDRRLRAETPLAVALAFAQDKARESTSARLPDGVDPRAEVEAPVGRADHERIMRFLRASREIQAQTSADAQLRLLLDRGMALFGAERGLLVKIGSDSEQAVKKARLAPGRDLPEDDRGYSTSLVTHVVQTCEVVVLPDAQAHLEIGERPSVVDLQLRSLLAVPLRLRGRIVYVMLLEDRTAPGRFQEEDRELAESFGALGAHALEGSRLREERELQDAELAKRRKEIELLTVALEAERYEQAHQLDAVKAALKGREYELGVQSSYANIVGRSEPMLRLFRLLEKVGSSDVPILIQGESGTGKELVARAVHFNGLRKEQPFLSINVAALPESLLEAELFGHVKGAFTGADRDKIGLFEAADHGTLFLDEVGDMAPAMQTKLLRVLQEGEVRPVGAQKSRKVNVRIVSASNKDLRKLVEEGLFRADLFYRLNVVSVALPALRERKEDIPLLVDHLLDRIAEKSDEKRKSVDRKVIDNLLHHDWPGNVRELENELRRLVALSGMRITERDLSPHVRQRPTDRPEGIAPTEDPAGQCLKDRMGTVERRILVDALRLHKNNKTKTAKALGLSRYGFLKKLDKYQLRDVQD